MKLISCYIENFGGLHQYAMNFDEGLTVVEAPNGFGKTTLAEFIRAMFYGFPRASKDLQKNPRQKYLPWQGGKFGGWLLFEHNGHRYRIERTFGEKPAQDKFKLIDEDTGRESAAYTANIGEELFGIDSDAFQRSTYLPQNFDGGPLSTDSIRAKLGNLLEDTGDMSGYEKALSRLQERRKQYELLRGNGGSIYRAQQQITTLQQEIRAAESRRPELSSLRTEADAARAEQQAVEAELNAIRDQISHAARLQTDAALSHQYEGLCTRVTAPEARLQQLNAAYPQGMPSEDVLEQANTLMDQTALLKNSLSETDADRTAVATAERLAPVFAHGMPEDEDLARGETLYKESLTLHSRLDAAVMQETDARLLDKLEAQFAPGVPDDAQFQAWDTACSNLSSWKRQQADIALSPRDSARLQELEHLFTLGIPTDEALSNQKKTWEQAQALRQDALHIEAAIVPVTAPTARAKPFHGGVFPAMLLALLFGAAGGYLLAMQSALLGIFTLPALPALQSALDFIAANPTLVGGISLGIGGLLLVLAIILQVMQSLRNEMARSAIAAAEAQAGQQARADHLRKEAAQMEADVQHYLARYPMHSDLSPTGQLRELADRAETLTELRERKARLEKEAAAMGKRIAALEEELSRQLQPYTTLRPMETAVITLRSRRDRYLALLETRKQVEETASSLQAALDAVRKELAALLRPYCGDVVPAAFHNQLTTLRRNRDAYTSAHAHLTARQEALARRDTQAAELEQKLLALGQPYALSLTTKARVDEVRDDLRLRDHLQQEIASAKAELDAFCNQHGHRPASALPEVLPDMDALKAAEAQCFRRHSQCADTLARLRRREQQVLDVLDTLPELQDSLSRITEQKAQDSHHRDLLDTTTALLQQARESLSNRYLGGVHSSFTHYLTRLTGEAPDKLRMNSDLEVQLERSGEARPLGYFSAGQADIMGLCMRLSLADALFEGESCFMILDDPFVNLDDAHTRQALELLQELAEERQFIYLVCHSSRVL